MSNALLSPQENSQLLSILFSSKNKSFDATAQAFQAAFHPPARFASLSAALLLLEDSKALLLPQRLATWYTLFCSWPDGPATNPFVSFLLRACEGCSASDVEKALCVQLLGQHQLEQLSRQVPAEYALGAGHSHQGVPCSLQDPGFRQQLGHKYACLQKQEQQQQQQQAGPAAEQQKQQQQLQQDALCFSWSVPPGTLPWQRPAPPVLPALRDELHWLYPDLHTSLVWDSSIGEDMSEVEAARELAGRAVRGPLLPAQQQRVLAALETHPRLAHRLGILPQHLPALVEHCPALASALLLRLLRPRPSGRAAELLGVLARSEMSLHGMEVVNRLAASVELPPEFVHLYITNCIHSCESTQDKYVQSRLVRLVCVFLQSLIRNRILAAADLLHELQAFCINFSRIREAAKLFRLLKQIEGGGPQSPTGLAAGSGSGGSFRASSGDGSGAAGTASALAGVEMLRTEDVSAMEDAMMREEALGSSSGGSSHAGLAEAAAAAAAAAAVAVPGPRPPGAGPASLALSRSPETAPIYLALPPTPDLMAIVAGQQQQQQVQQ